VNIYEILADVTVAVHLAYMGYVVFGQLLILIGWPLRWGWIRNRWFRLSHLAMVLIVAFETVVGWRCPLTTWEEQLREAVGQVVPDRWEDGHLFTGEVEGISFTGRLLRRVQFAGDLCPQNINTIFYVAAGIIVATVFLVPPRLRKKPAAPVASAPVGASPSPPVPGPELEGKERSPPADVPFNGDAHETVRHADDA
jgi:Protein of Unknown function (DUF2784)